MTRSYDKGEALPISKTEIEKNIIISREHHYLKFSAQSNRTAKNANMILRLIKRTFKSRDANT